MLILKTMIVLTKNIKCKNLKIPLIERADLQNIPKMEYLMKWQINHVFSVPSPFVAHYPENYMVKMITRKNLLKFVGNKLSAKISSGYCVCLIV